MMISINKLFAFCVLVILSTNPNIGYPQDTKCIYSNRDKGLKIPRGFYSVRVRVSPSALKSKQKAAF